MVKVKVKYKEASKTNEHKINFSKVLGTFSFLISLGIFAVMFLPIGLQYVAPYLKDIFYKPVEPSITEIEYYDPGASYFENIVVNSPLAEQSEQNSKIVVNTTYTSPLTITIDAVGISNIKITSNVDSSDKNRYETALKQGVAHFKYTPLPGDGGNSFIYGHSTTDNVFNKYPNLPETIFTRLKDIDIGDTVQVVRDGKTLEYKTIMVKITSPEDLTMLSGIEGKEIVTLMTCWPLGVGTHRLIIIAERLEL